MRTSIPAGKLLRRGQLQRVKAAATIESGGHVDLSNDANWEFVQNRWVSIVPASSREFMVADQLNAQTTHQITMRHDTLSSSVTTDWRLKYNGKTYNISGPPTNRNMDNVLLDFPAIEVG